MLFIQSCPPLFLVSLASPNTDDLEERNLCCHFIRTELSPVEKGKGLPARGTYPWSWACVVTAKPSHIYSSETLLLLRHKFVLFITKSFPIERNFQTQLNPFFFFICEEKS